METKKIIIVGTAHPYRGGLSAFNQRVAYECVQQGYDVEVYTFTLQYPSFLFPGKTQYTDEKPTHNLTIHRKINSINPLNWIKVGKEIKAKKADKVIFCYWMAFFAPCFGTIARNCKAENTECLGLIHNMIPHDPTILDKLFPKYFVNAMDGFMAMTNSVVDDINHFDKKNKPKRVSPHPVYDQYGKPMNREEALQALNLDADFRYILFFGFVRKYKGLDLLLNAFADARLRQFPVKLIVAGEFYESEEPYLEIIRKNALEESVILHSNFIPDDKVKFYFNSADLVAQTYHSATQSGVSQIAYNFEKPMLVTDVGGLSETVPHGKVGYVVKTDVKEVADALVDYFENNRLQEFTENVKVEKQRFSWSTFINELLAVGS
ncbi:MAG: glycosyltransferase [Lentimicrobiaceae bacterium]|nr:glycosyltransferase [Lentimicrobiaceae bacterium]